MEVDSNFSSLFQTLKLDDPWLPSRPWECISSESGVSHPQISNSNSSFHDSLYEPSTISEVNLVRLSINALQGVEASLRSIEKLAESFSTDPADRTSHRIPSLWHRSSSTNAFGKILKTIGSSGFTTFLIRRFVDYIHQQNLNVDDHGSLVSQAFAVALEKALEGFTCALDTLYASVELRRSPEKLETSEKGSLKVGCLTSVAHSEITFVEVYLHTRELRTQVEAIGNICMFKNVGLAFSTSTLENLTAEVTVGFANFPKGADLLSYLYTQLRDVDPVHRALFKFLFVCSCQPYYGFIKSWIYEARIYDPYKEFIVEYMAGSPSSHGGASFVNAGWLPSIRVREGVHVPCFLEKFCLPLLRAGQQLQVLIKLLELCNWVHAGDQSYEDILPFWSRSSSICFSTLSPLTFSKTRMEEMVLMRENMYRVVQEKLEILIAGLDRRYQPMVSSVMPFGVPMPGNYSRDTANFPVSSSMDKYLIDPTVNRGDSNSESGSRKSESSGSTDDSSYQMDPFESSSECSSWNSSEEQIETEQANELDDSSIETELKMLSASGYFRKLSNQNTFPNPSQNDKSSSLECVHRTTIERVDPVSRYSDHHYESKSSHVSEQYKSETAAESRYLETLYADYQSMNCWPLGGIPKNPFCVDRGSKGEFPFIDSSLEVPEVNEEVLLGEDPCSKELPTSDSVVPQETRGDFSLESVIHELSNSHISSSWKLKYNCNVFTTNPMLTKNAWGQMIDISMGRSWGNHKQSSLSYFDFSSVKDPHLVYGERLIVSPGPGFQSKNHLLSNSSLSSTKAVNQCFGEQKYDEPSVPVDQTNFLSGIQSENRQEENTSTSCYGGAEWESSLSYLGKEFKRSSAGNKQSSGPAFDIPLDIIIEKCMLQEISLQYKYISSFTIKLLEEGFDLQEHLLALRRYHFMEFADWADLFIISLWRHNWSVAEASEKISEIQGFLDLAVQRSSCEGDPYKERIYLHMKAHDLMPVSVPTTGVHAFDFIALGYRVDWPVSIVLTPSALKIYANIFSFLIQVKLAVFSLTDVWCSMKELVNLISQNHQPGLNEQEKTYINMLLRMRHQINHFVSTLQQYVQSQLSHVSWCKFLHSLKHQVKDMFDLESVHMAYLADSLHICFLSDEARPIASIIECILQCALDFRSCFTKGCWDVGLEGRDLTKICGRLNVSQVVAIKRRFERILKELYVCYLRSPKHGEFSLCRFWGYLNYNDYYSSVITGNGI